MLKEDLKLGVKVKHFKGTTYKILGVAMHTETKEDLVVYQSLDNDKIYARPIEMFISKVDREKYPDIKQEYRFEILKV